MSVNLEFYVLCDRVRKGPSKVILHACHLLNVNRSFENDKNVITFDKQRGRGGGGLTSCASDILHLQVYRCSASSQYASVGHLFLSAFLCICFVSCLLLDNFSLHCRTLTTSFFLFIRTAF